MLGATAKLSPALTEARQLLGEITQKPVKSMYETMVLDAFAGVGVVSASDLKSDETLGNAAQRLGLNTDGLLRAMKGQCPFGHLNPATAKAPAQAE